MCFNETARAPKLFYLLQLYSSYNSYIFYNSNITRKSVMRLGKEERDIMRLRYSGFNGQKKTRNNIRICQTHLKELIITPNHYSSEYSKYSVTHSGISPLSALSIRCKMAPPQSDSSYSESVAVCQRTLIHSSRDAVRITDYSIIQSSDAYAWSSRSFGIASSPILEMLIQFLHNV